MYSSHLLIVGAALIVAGIGRLGNSQNKGIGFQGDTIDRHLPSRNKLAWNAKGN